MGCALLTLGIKHSIVWFLIAESLVAYGTGFVASSRAKLAVTWFNYKTCCAMN